MQKRGSREGKSGADINSGTVEAKLVHVALGELLLVVLKDLKENTKQEE